VHLQASVSVSLPFSTSPTTVQLCHCIAPATATPTLFVCHSPLRRTQTSPVPPPRSTTPRQTPRSPLRCPHPCWLASKRLPLTYTLCPVIHGSTQEPFHYHDATAKRHHSTSTPLDSPGTRERAHTTASRRQPRSRSLVHPHPHAHHRARLRVCS
jgi:hypothetical protein